MSTCCLNLCFNHMRMLGNSPAFACLVWLTLVTTAGTEGCKLEQNHQVKDRYGAVTSWQVVLQSFGHEPKARTQWHEWRIWNLAWCCSTLPSHLYERQDGRYFINYEMDKQCKWVNHQGRFSNFLAEVKSYILFKTWALCHLDIFNLENDEGEVH